ncbi:unnamed protein product, partial [Mesorhabditis spiculigera]
MGIDPRPMWIAQMAAEGALIALHMGVVLSAFSRFCAIVQYSQYKAVLSRRGTFTYIVVQIGTAFVVRSVLPPGNHPERTQGGTIDRDTMLTCMIHFACASAAVLLAAPLYAKSHQALNSNNRKGWKSSAVRTAEIRRLRFCLAALIFPLFYSLLQLVLIGVLVKNHKAYREILRILGWMLLCLFVTSQPLSVVLFSSVLPKFSIIARIQKSKYAYASTLSSNDFLLAAEVLAYRINSFNDYPYIVVATEDITNKSIEALKSLNVTVIVKPKIDTPYKASHKAAKYQYTKIYLWSLTQYKKILHLDLDTIPMRPLSEVFQCGSFCATFRHSDRFNSGVFVLEPNMTVYHDMLEKVDHLVSYDGGDQGFLNTYFDQLKYAPMFDGSSLSTKFPRPDGLRTLSWSYNYDVGIYYITGGRLLLQPKIMHFTLGPVKPWLWWSYPIFNLNWEWLAVRTAMEAEVFAPRNDFYLLIASSFLVGIFYSIYQILHFYWHGKYSKVELTKAEELLIPSFIFCGGILAAFQIIPTQTHPSVAWTFFFVNMILWQVFLAGCYRSIRSGLRLPICECARFCCISLCICCGLWMALLSVSNFYLRSLLLLSAGPSGAISIFFLLRRLMGMDKHYRVSYALIEQIPQMVKLAK